VPFQGTLNLAFLSKNMIGLREIAILSFFIKLNWSRWAFGDYFLSKFNTHVMEVFYFFKFSGAAFLEKAFL